MATSASFHFGSHRIGMIFEVISNSQSFIKIT